MKIMFITDVKISSIGGGSISQYRIYDGLVNYLTENDELIVFSPDNDLKYSSKVKIVKSKKQDILSRVFFHSSYMFFQEKKINEMILSFSPDVIIYGRSRLGFFIIKLKKKLTKCKFICFVENIEYDYVDGYFANKKNLIGKIEKVIERIVVKRDEKRTLNNSDIIVYLSTRDKLRAESLYNTKQIENYILPICLEREISLCKKSDKVNIAFIGSLGYASNSSAVKKFIQTVWKPFFSENDNINFVIAGRNPDEELMKMVSNYDNITLYNGFSKLEDIIETNTMIIAPIEKGAGMKVKVAESLAMGTFIAASDESLVGYDEIIEMSDGIIRCNSCEDYKDAICNFMTKSNDEVMKISLIHKSLYKKYYSLDRSRKMIYDILDKNK